jgi:hypothetical protein
LFVAGDVLIFLKLYDPKRKTISYCGHTYVPITAKTGLFIGSKSFVCKLGIDYKK